jgi:hypothetical protein
VLEVGDDHDVVREPRGHRECLRERLAQEIPELERRANDDVTGVELPCNQAPVVPPVEKPVATPLDDPVELGGQAAQILEFQLRGSRPA